MVLSRLGRGITYMRRDAGEEGGRGCYFSSKMPRIMSNLPDFPRRPFLYAHLCVYTKSMNQPHKIFRIFSAISRTYSQNSFNFPHMKCGNWQNDPIMTMFSKNIFFHAHGSNSHLQSNFSKWNCSWNVQWEFIKINFALSALGTGTYLFNTSAYDTWKGKIEFCGIIHGDS